MSWGLRAQKSSLSWNKFKIASELIHGTVMGFSKTHLDLRELGIGPVFKRKFRLDALQSHFSALKHHALHDGRWMERDVVLE
jgi:hypothetical protein